MTGPLTDRTPAQQRRSRGVASFRAALESSLGIDQRALGAFRIALGVLLLADLTMLRLPGLVTFYTDAGVFPRSTLLEAYPTVGRVSIHALSGAAWFQAVLFALAGGFALLLLVGYRTRLATLGSLVLFASLHARNPHLVNGGDTILLSFLLFGWSWSTR
ncbi:MAG: HTTM domain-containing protein, partial [Natrinema limicola]